MSGMPWVKLYTEILDDVKILRLSDAQKWRFIQLILFAGECDAEGFIVKGNIPMTIMDMAWRLRIDEDVLRDDLEQLKTNYLMDFDEEESAWFVEKFSDRQGRSQAGKRKQWRERQRKHRENLKIQVFERSSGLCEYCGDPITYDTFVVEHILPPFRGGSTGDIENLAASCRSCNTLKGDKIPEEAGLKNPRKSDNENVTGDKISVTPLEEEREEEEEKEEEKTDGIGHLFSIYEQEIGPLTPMISDEIGDWMESYSNIWIEDAIKIASQRNKRNSSYIYGILKNWQSEGRGDKNQSSIESELKRKGYAKR